MRTGRSARPGTGGEAVADRGFALLVALLAIVGLTALATGGLFLARSEAAVSRSHGSAVEALYAASAGLERYLAEHDSIGGTPTYDFGSAGTAEIRLDTLVEADPRTIPDAGAEAEPPKLFRISSTGRTEVAGGAPATRTVSAVAMDYRLRLDTDSLKTLIMALNGIDVGSQSGSGYIDGDAISDCAVPEDVTAIAAPSDDSHLIDDAADLRGSVTPRVDSLRSSAELLDLVHRIVPWKRIVGGDLMDADHVIAGSSDWPSSIMEDRIYLVTDPDHSTGSGTKSYQGVLITTGDLQFKGNWTWKGVALIGGALRTTEATPNLQGVFVTGLNRLLCNDSAEEYPCPSSGTRSVADDTQISGNASYDHDPCSIDGGVRRLAEHTQTLALQPRTWWESY